MSVSGLIYAWPQFKPDYSQVKPEVLENARERGIEVDALFSQYVNGTLDVIRKGMWRTDAVQLFFKVRRWWDARKHDEAKAQVILADDEVAGTCDIVDGDTIYDLKCTSKISSAYHLQLAAYGELHYATFRRPVKKLAIIHITEKFPEPKIVTVDLVEAMQDWMTMRQFWRMVSRRVG